MTIQFQLYDSLLSPVAVVDQELSVVYFNQAFAQFFGLPPRKIRGKPIAEVIPAGAPDAVREAFATGNQIVTPETAVQAGADTKEVVLKAAPVDGGVVLTVQDFSLERILHAKHRVQLDEIKRYSEGLEVLVEQRTKELRTAKEETESILRSIREGIFVIEKDGTIGVQCSGAALSLLRQPELRGRNAVETLFPDVERTGQADERKKVRDFLAQAFNLFIPEQFDDLTRFLPKSIRFPEDRVYGLSFSAVIDDGSVLRVVVAVRDDTELEQLRNLGVTVHKRVVEALGQAAAQADGPKAAAYRGFLAEAAALVDSVVAATRDLAAADVTALFRALHTVKGGARLYELAFLQHFAHTAEDVLDGLRAGRVTATAAVTHALAGDVQMLAAGVKALARLTAEGTPAAAEDDADTWIAVASNFVDSATTLARDLGKAASFMIHASYAPVGKDLRVLSTVLTHLVRNAVDHGLETTEQRRQAGKPATGSLSLTLDCVNGCFFGRFADDGGGVDLAEIRRRGVALGLVAPNAEHVGNAEALRVLAAPGFSTKEAVTEISGRGVGLDAVLAELKANGGHLALERTDERGTSFTFSWEKLEDETLPLDRATSAA